MVQDVYSDQKMGDYLSDNFVCYKVNAEKANGPDLAFLFEVKVYPTLLWLDHKGRVVQRHEGAAYHAELMRLSEEAMRTKREKI
jgi:thioredoxin-related protein